MVEERSPLKRDISIRDTQLQNNAKLVQNNSLYKSQNTNHSHHQTVVLKESMQPGGYRPPQMPS